jgi:hypothetical protein
LKEGKQLQVENYYLKLGYKRRLHGSIVDSKGMYAHEKHTQRKSLDKRNAAKEGKFG